MFQVLQSSCHCFQCGWISRVWLYFIRFKKSLSITLCRQQYGRVPFYDFGCSFFYNKKKKDNCRKHFEWEMFMIAFYECMTYLKKRMFLCVRDATNELISYMIVKMVRFRQRTTSNDTHMVAPCSNTHTQFMCMWI